MAAMNVDGLQTPHPEYYKSLTRDLYAIFIEKYGLDTWLAHAEMECIQYLWRCRDKGMYADDIRKTKIICERVLEELSQAGRSPQ